MLFMQDLVICEQRSFPVSFSNSGVSLTSAPHLTEEVQSGRHSAHPGLKGKEFTFLLHVCVHVHEPMCGHL